MKNSQILLELLILKTINSVLNQSYNNYEIIIIYDDENLSDLDYLEKLFKLEKKVVKKLPVGSNGIKVLITNKIPES